MDDKNVNVITQEGPGDAGESLPAQLQAGCPTYSGRGNFLLGVEGGEVFEELSSDAEERLLRGELDHLGDPALVGSIGLAGTDVSCQRDPALVGGIGLAGTDVSYQSNPASVGSINSAEPMETQPFVQISAGHRPVEGFQPPTTLPPAEKIRSKKLSGAAKRGITRLMAEGVSYEEARAIVIERRNPPAGQEPGRSDASGAKELDSGQRSLKRDRSEEESPKLQPKKRENAKTTPVRANVSQRGSVGVGPVASRFSTENPAGEGPRPAASSSVSREPQPSTSSHGITSFRDAAAGLRLGVFNKVPLTQDQLKLTRKAILVAVWEGKDGQVRFLGSDAKPEGWLQITCADMPSRLWLMDRVPSLVPFPGAVLSVRTDLPKRRIGFIVVSRDEEQNPRQVFAGLEVQNDGLNTSGWKIVRVEETEGNHLSITFYLDDASVEHLRKLNFKPYFGFRRINVRVKGEESAGGERRTASTTSGAAIAGSSGTPSGETGSSAVVSTPENVVVSGSNVNQRPTTSKPGGVSQPARKTLTQGELAKRGKPRYRGKPKPRGTGSAPPSRQPPAPNPPRRPPQN